MLHLHIKILPGAEGVVFRRDVFVGNDNRKIFDDFLVVENADDLVFLGGGE